MQELSFLCGVGAFPFGNAKQSEMYCIVIGSWPTATTQSL